MQATAGKKSHHGSPHHRPDGQQHLTSNVQSPSPRDSEEALISVGSPVQQTPEMMPMSSESLLMAEKTSDPMTPTRPHSMYEGNHARQLSGTVSASDGNSKRRKSSQRTRSQRPNPSPMNSRPNSTPRSKGLKTTQTPGKVTPTLSQAYAGPTFHASPAASSLPMPKFFQRSLSKSVPENTQAKSLTAFVDSEVSEEIPSPESSEPSPIREKAERRHQRAREESPLDIFFRADREEKTRALLANITNRDDANTPDFGNSIGGDMLRGIPAPASEIPRHHSRQHTGNSTAGLFPMDMEQEGPQLQSPNLSRLSVSNHPTNLSRANSGRSDYSTEAFQEDIARREARSAELMKLLGTEKPKKPISPSTRSDCVSTPGSNKHSSQPTYEPSGPSTATSQPDPKVQILSRKQPASLPQLQKQFGLPLPSNQSPRARPPSNLRQEVSVPPSPAQDVLQELPATSTPSRSANLPLKPLGNGDLFYNDTASSLPSSAEPGVGLRQMQDPKVLSMENDLRRILRLDTLASDGANGVKF